MKNIHYKRPTIIKPTMRPTAGEVRTVAVELVKITRETIMSPAADLSTLAMALALFEADAAANGFTPELITQAKTIGAQMAATYIEVAKKKAERAQNGLVGLDGEPLEDQTISSDEEEQVSL